MGKARHTPEKPSMDLGAELDRRQEEDKRMENNTQPSGKAPQGNWTVMSVPDLDAWWIPEPGKIMAGVLLAQTSFQDRRRNVRPMYLIKIEMPVAAKVTGSGKNEPLEMMPEGAIIAVVQSFGLSSLEDIHCNYDKPRVLIRSVEKKDLSNGNTMWKYDVAFEPGKTGRRKEPVKIHLSKTARVIEDNDSGNGGAPIGPDDDLPF